MGPVYAALDVSISRNKCRGMTWHGDQEATAEKRYNQAYAETESRIALGASMMILSSLLFAAMPTNAATTPAKITYLHSTSSFFAFALQGIPSGCSGGSGQFFVTWSTTNGDKIFALMLSAYESGDLLSVVGSDCNSPVGANFAETSDVDVRKQ